MTDKQFPKGIYIDEITTKFGTMEKLSVKVEDFAEYMVANQNAKGYLNIDVKRAKNGNKPYLELNTYVKPTTAETQESFAEEFDDEVVF